MFMDMFSCSGFRTWTWRRRIWWRRRRWRRNLRRILSLFTFSLWIFTHIWPLPFQVIIIQNFHHLRHGEESFSKLFPLMRKSLFRCHLLTLRSSLSQSDLRILFKNPTFTTIQLFLAIMQTQKPTVNFLWNHLIRKDLLKTMVELLKNEFINHLGIWRKRKN